MAVNIFKLLSKRFCPKEKSENDYILPEYRKLDKRTIEWMKENDIPLDRPITIGKFKKRVKSPGLRLLFGSDEPKYHFKKYFIAIGGALIAILLFLSLFPH